FTVSRPGASQLLPVLSLAVSRFLQRRQPPPPLFPYTTLFRSVRIDTLPIVCFHASKSGGFFMVRSYYPSECHADYFDFERIEAQIGRAVQQECRDRSRMPSSA